MRLKRRLKGLLDLYFLKGIKPNDNPEVIKQILITNFFSIFGCSIMFVIGGTALFAEHWIHGFTLLSASFVFFVSYWIPKTKLVNSPFVVAENIMLATIMLLMLYLIHFGGSANTGPLWIYIIPPITLFFGGLQRGLKILSVFLIAVCTLLFFPNDALLATTYSLEFKTRLIYSFLTVSSLFIAYEYIREKSYNDLVLLKQKFELQAKHDMLSGLFNRRGMMECLTYEFKRNKRVQSDLSLIMCDLDKFKLINDEYGHEKGDEVIKKVAHIFQCNLREQDTLARWGGEEYLFLLPMTNIRQATILAEKLRKKIESATFEHDNKTFSVTVSMGIYQYHAKDGINDMINRADNNLYKAKDNGRNCCVS